jgi:hypothetical protein
MIITGGVVISGGVRMTPLVAPSVPTITSVVMSDIDAASITFTAPSSNGGLPIRSYTAFSIPPGATGTVNTSGSGIVTVTGLSSSTFYRFGLYASNQIGDGGSTVSNIILPFTWGSAEYTIPGSYTWFSPSPYITSVSVLAIGGGGAGKTSSGSTVSSGQGGASNFVSSGIIQASGGTNANSSGSGNFGGGGGAGTGTTGVVVFVGGSGGGGVACATGGGGGAAGYAGNGGSGAASGSIASAGAGGGGGGGGVVTAGFGAGGGGVGIYGNSSIQATTSPGFYAYSFDGSGDMLTVNSLPGPGTATDFTYEAWVYPTSSSVVYRTIFGIDNYGSGAAFRLYQYGTAFQYWYNGSGGSINSGVILINRWHHLAITRAGTSIRFFVNGVQVGTTLTTTVSHPTSNFRIGMDAAGSFPFVGLISNLRVINGTAVYTSNFGVPIEPLTAIANTVLLTAQNTSFRDNSTNNYSVVASGNVSIENQFPFSILGGGGNGGVSGATFGGGGGGGSGGSAGTSTVISGTPGGGGRFGGGGGGGAAGGGAGLAYLNTVTVAFGQGYNITVGAGGVASGTALANGAGGAVRIVYPAQSRVFPSTNVGSCAAIADLNSYSTPTASTITNISYSTFSVNYTYTATVAYSTPSSNGGLPIYQYILSVPSIGLTTSSFTSTGGTFTISNLSTTVTSYSGVLSAVNIIGSITTEFLLVNSVVPSVEYLVVGGGGGGGSLGGGGGAGGFRTGSVPTAPQTYTITVGAGGNGAVAYTTRGSNGSNSVFGSIVALGGGGGGSWSATTGRDGGSGGGAASGSGSISGGSGEAGPPRQGYNGGNATPNGVGGGGGAGAAGTSSSTSGAGGIGLQSNITGTATYYAGGGGGGAWASSYSAASGGLGGGGTSSAWNIAGTGTTNTGGGGGGGGFDGSANFAPGGAGGSGIVVIRYPDVYSAALSTTGSPTVTVSGGYRIYVFTQSGSIKFY